jgi:hypothetical protein
MGAASIVGAAAAEKIRVLVPIGPGVLPASDYSDRFHLNRSGAAKFTTALAAGLRQALLTDTNRDQTQTASFKMKASPSSRE